MSRVITRFLLLASAVGRIVQCQDSQFSPTAVFDAIDAKTSGLSNLNREIYSNPELAFNEHHAHSTLTAFLTEQGFNVTPGAYNISTAFVAEFSSADGGKSISFNAEYDALAGLGHACGHNLIATSSVAAALGVKYALEKLGVSGRVVLLGTPAEEGGGGKVRLLDAGAYEGLECSLMGHPGTSTWGSYAPTSAMWAGNVTWTGAPAHAALAPWLGRNAMDGFVSAYTMTGLYRQQIRPSDRVHHVIANSAQVRNIIPENAASVWGVRGDNIAQRDIVLEQILNIINASALATGTTVQVNQTMDYFNMVPNEPLAISFYNSLLRFFDPTDAVNNGTNATFAAGDVNDEIKNAVPAASTDQGNVSNKLPALHVIFPISSTASPHTPAFQVAAGTTLAYQQAIRTGRLLALTGLEVLRNETFAKIVKEGFKG